MRNSSKIYFSKFMIKEVHVNNVSLPLELFSCWQSVSENKRKLHTWNLVSFPVFSMYTLYWQVRKNCGQGQPHPGPDHIQESILRLLPHRHSLMVWPDPVSGRSHQTSNLKLFTSSLERDLRILLHCWSYHCCWCPNRNNCCRGPSTPGSSCGHV